VVYPIGSQRAPKSLQMPGEGFSFGRPRALDRNAEVRIMHWARCLSRRTRGGQGLRPAHRQGAGGARGASVGLPQTHRRVSFNPERCRARAMQAAAR
jgi:hypothetical protein